MQRDIDLCAPMFCRPHYRTRRPIRRLSYAILVFLTIAFWLSYATLARWRLAYDRLEYHQSRAEVVPVRLLTDDDIQLAVSTRSTVSQNSGTQGDFTHASQPNESKKVQDVQRGGNAKRESLEDQVQPPVRALQMVTPWSKNYRFPARADCDSVKDKADALPDMVVVPFGEAVRDMDLAGWEDLWVSQARYVGPKLAEPKIDFVYTCSYSTSTRYSRD